MERDELEQTIAAEIRQAINDCLDTNKSISKSSHDCSGRILSLLDGWKSPEKVEKIKVEEWWRGRHDNG
jgi:hypothetical protein